MIEGDVKRLSLLGTALIATIPSRGVPLPRRAGARLAPVATGALAGIAARLLGHGVVHGHDARLRPDPHRRGGRLLHLSLLQAERDGAAGDESWIAGFWPTIRLACHLHRRLFGPAPLGAAGLSQLGPVTPSRARPPPRDAIILPALLRQDSRLRDGFRHRERPRDGFGRRHARLRVAVPLLAIAAVAVLATRAGTLWDPDLASLNPIPERTKALDAELRGALGAPDARSWWRSPDRRRTRPLAAAESVGRQLDRSCRRKTCPATKARALPGRACHAAGAPPRACRMRPTLRARLALALADLPLRPTSWNPSWRTVEKARAQPPHHRARRSPAPPSTRLDGLLFANASGQWTAMIA